MTDTEDWRNTGGDIIAPALIDLQKKMYESGRQPAPNAVPEFKHNAKTNTFTLTIVTVPLEDEQAEETPE